MRVAEEVHDGGEAEQGGGDRACARPRDLGVGNVFWVVRRVEVDCSVSGIEAEGVEGEVAFGEKRRPAADVLQRARGRVESVHYCAVSLYDVLVERSVCPQAEGVYQRPTFRRVCVSGSKQQSSLANFPPAILFLLLTSNIFQFAACVCFVHTGATNVFLYYSPGSYIVNFDWTMSLNTGNKIEL